MLNLKLPYWLSGPHLKQLSDAAQTYWGIVEAWLTWPLNQLDVGTCSESILDLFAWQRDVERFDGEDLNLYRLRVQYAFVNGKESGTRNGLTNIIQRLGVGYSEITERQDPVNWDVIEIHLSDSQLSSNPEILKLIVNKYGRTCRRYTFINIAPLTLFVNVAEVGSDQQNDFASL